MRKARLLVAALLVSLATAACEVSMTSPSVDPGGTHVDPGGAHVDPGGAHVDPGGAH